MTGKASSKAGFYRTCNSLKGKISPTAIQSNLQANGCPVCKSEANTDLAKQFTLDGSDWITCPLLVNAPRLHIDGVESHSLYALLLGILKTAIV